MLLATEISSRLRPRALLISLVVLGVIATLGIALGAVALPVQAIFLEFVDRLPGVDVNSGLDERQIAILWQLRMPRVALAGLVGGLLAIAGGAYQGVFRNPLADPYLLGVAAGAGLGATLALIAGTEVRAALPIIAFLGGLLAVVAAYSLARAGGARPGAATLILAGVAVAAFFAAVQTFLLQVNAETIREVYAWILGRLATVGWDEVLLLIPFALVASSVLLLHRRSLDVLAVGEDEAATLGLRSVRVRWWVILGATLGTAAAVSVSGLIAFVGIVVPHTIRLLFGWSYRVILPLSLILGAAFLILADLVARTVVAPGELPVGVVTAIVGAPFFAIVLWTTRRRLR